MYHSVKDFNAGKDSIQPWEFEKDLIYLQDNNYEAITMSDIINYVYNDIELPEKPIILSFDDGYLNNYVYVFPLLKKYNAKIVFSIIGKDIDNFSKDPGSSLEHAHVTWDQLNEMLDSGLVEVQNHSYDLHCSYGRRLGCRKLPEESDSEYEIVLKEDIGGLQNKIELMTGVTPSTFVYPLGIWNDKTDNVLKELGFKASITCKYGINNVRKNPEDLFHMKRICRSHNKSLSKVLVEGLRSGL